MNSKFILFAVLCFVAAFSACKDDETDQSATNTPLIKTMVTKGNYSDSVNYEYDATGKVMKAYFDDISYTKYTYTSGKINIDTHYPDPAYNRSSSVRVNSKGLATSQQYGDILYTFKYDSIGYHVVTNFNYDTVYYAKIVDGNTILKKEIHLSSNKINVTWEYEFLPNKNTIGDQNIGIIYRGKQDNNLPSKETEVIREYNSVREIIKEYTYEFDSQNRVTKRSTIRNGNLYITEYYTYY